MYWPNLAVADAYDAMTSARPYRKLPLSIEQAKGELLIGRDTQFDSLVVDTMILLLNEESNRFDIMNLESETIS